MHLGRVIQTRWAANGTLQGLLPASKVMVGIYFAEDPIFPYGTITLPGTGPSARANDGAATNTVIVRVAVYHDRNHYDACKAIADAVQSAFESTNFSLTGSDKVLDVRSSIPQEIQDQETGDWTFVIDLECKVYLAAGV